MDDFAHESSLVLLPRVFAFTQIRRQHIQGMGVDISVGESLDDLADLLERAHAPFRDLTWETIFPMPTAGALAGHRNALFNIDMYFKTLITLTNHI